MSQEVREGSYDQAAKENNHDHIYSNSNPLRSSYKKDDKDDMEQSKPQAITLFLKHIL